MSKRQPEYVNQANKVLRELDAYYPDSNGISQLYKLVWSGDIRTLVPKYSADPTTGEMLPEMEYRCQCGVNRVVHTPDCSQIAVAKTVFIWLDYFGPDGIHKSYNNCWALCRWHPPVSKEIWIDMMGTDEDYPRNGRYMPVHRGLHCVVIPPSAGPLDYVDGARLMVHMIREHMSTLEAEQEKSQRKQTRLDVPIMDEVGNIIREPDKDSRYWRIFERVKEKMRRFNPTGTVGYSSAASHINLESK